VLSENESAGVVVGFATEVVNSGESAPALKLETPPPPPPPVIHLHGGVPPEALALKTWPVTAELMTLRQGLGFCARITPANANKSTSTFRMVISPP